ncbi:Dephospho-CoA kinase, partial [Dispira parvispora]
NTGELDRAKLGTKVFGDEALRKRLNSITHPRVRREMFKQVLFYYLRGEPMVLLDVPLLFESRLDRFVTDSVVVYCPQDIQLERLMQRNGFDETAAQQRIGAQMLIAHKRDRADFVIDNSGDLEITKTQ